MFARLPLLPRRQGAALLLHAVHGLPHEDIARQMHTSPAATRILVHRARATLHPMEV